MEYIDFLERKAQLSGEFGFNPVFMPDYLFDFQKHIVEWSVKKGRGGVFADCGLGKTAMQLVWAENVIRKTNGRVIITTPLSVGYQTAIEAEKFSIDAVRSSDGKPANNITITNYEKLHLFDPNDFIGIVCDESSILKNFDGKRRKIITEFMKKMPYRLLCTATAAPNDYIELGTSSEALGSMGHMDMLCRFFKNSMNSCDTGRFHGHTQKWRFKQHAQVHFWRWVCSWAIALRRPSDIGFDDNGFNLPPLVERETIVPCSRPLDGKLFVEPAMNLREQRQERRATITERCEVAASKIKSDRHSIVWCHLNDEGDLLEKIIPDSKQVKGAMTDDQKESVFLGFQRGDFKTLITKPKIGAFGLNWQHCHHMTFFPSHSYEQYYQGVRRCWRFGQKNKVEVDIITTEGELAVLKNLKRKAHQADEMFDNLVGYMNDSITINSVQNFDHNTRIPKWL